MRFGSCVAVSNRLAKFASAIAWTRAAALRAREIVYSRSGCCSLGIAQFAGGSQHPVAS
jgi:hypothetical protein